MGQENFPRHAGRGGDGARQNLVGRGKGSTLQTRSASPHPIAIPIWE